VVLPTGYDPVSALYQSAVLPLNEESLVLAGGIEPPTSASFALASEASGQREHSTTSRAGSSLRSAARRGPLFQLSYASERKTNGRRSCFASPKSGSRTNAVQFLDAHDVKQHGHRWPIQTQSRIRARVKRERQQMSGRRIGMRMHAPVRREQRNARIGREFARYLNVVWAIGPLLPFGGGLALPPVNPVVLGPLRARSTFG
jgi:hypothetical protein